MQTASCNFRALRVSRARVPVRGIGDQHLELDCAVAPMRVVADVDRRRANRSAHIVLERQAERVTRTMIPRELVFVLYGRAGRGHGFREETKHRLDEVVADAGTEAAACASERRLGVLEIRVADGDAVQRDDVPGHGSGFFWSVSTVLIWKRNSWSTSWLTGFPPNLAG